MRIDEPIDHVTHMEHIKFEELCIDFRNVSDAYNQNDEYIFPEDYFVRKYDVPGALDSWYQVYFNAKHKLEFDLGSKNIEWEKAADFFRQFSLEQGNYLYTDTSLCVE